MEFSQIAILLVVAGVFGLVAKLLKQPLLIGYLFAGIALSLLGFIHDFDSFAGLSQIGVTLLLFLVGLEMNVNDLKDIGKPALLTGLGQIIFTSIFGFLIATLLGFAALPAIYIAVALTFSSTIIMVKLLGQKNDLNSLYGKISVGFLLVQDFVAVIILMFLSGLGSGGMSTSDILLLVGKGGLLLFTVWLFSKIILPFIFDKLLASSSELLFIGSVAWALGFASLVSGPFGFTLEIGGFLAGIALSGLSEEIQIASKMRPLRDFFLTIFFILLGTELAFGNITGVLGPAIVFSLFVLIGNPLIVLAIMGAMGYKRRTSFLAGLTVAQISEFSLILAAMGVALGHLGQKELSLIVLVGVVTMTLSTYMILGADRLYSFLKKPLGVFERKKTTEKHLQKAKEFDDHIVLVGGGRVGKSLVPYLTRLGEVLVIDFDPKVLGKLSNTSGVTVLFGDINDPDIVEHIHLPKAKLIISTINDTADNLVLLRMLKDTKHTPPVILSSFARDDAIKFYETGATYVVVSGIVAGEHIKHVLKTYGVRSKAVHEMGKRHYKRISQ